MESSDNRKEEAKASLEDIGWALPQIVCPVDPVADKSWIRLRFSSNRSIQTDGVHAGQQIRPGSNDAGTLSEGVKILKLEYAVKAITHFKMEQCLIFCRTNLDCDNFVQFLKDQEGGADSWSCVSVHAGRPESERTLHIKQFAEGKVKFLVCTDAVASDIDVKDVAYVINMTLPQATDTTTYLRRISRVSAKGQAISFVSTVRENVWCTNAKHDVQKNSTWINEMLSLSEIEESLGITISQVSTDFEIPDNDYDEKHERRGNNELSMDAVHLTGVIDGLHTLERQLQLNYWKLRS